MEKRPTDKGTTRLNHSQTEKHYHKSSLRKDQRRQKNEWQKNVIFQAISTGTQ